MASLACGITAEVPHEARVYGSEGSIAVHDFLGPRRCELLGPGGALVEAFEEDFADGFIFQIEHFAGLLRDGKLESDLIPLKDSIECAGVFDVLTGQWGLR